MKPGPYPFICPSCSARYPIRIDRKEYTVPDYCDLLRCDTCANTLVLHADDIDAQMSQRKFSPGEFEPTLESSLAPCKCGGHFKFSAPYRCPVCLSIVSVDEIKLQVNYEGDQKGAPLITMGIAFSSPSIWKR